MTNVDQDAKNLLVVERVAHSKIGLLLRSIEPFMIFTKTHSCMSARQPVKLAKTSVKDPLMQMEFVTKMDLCLHISGLM